MDAKLERIRDLINQKEEIETELASLIAGTEKPKRVRRTKAEIEAAKEKGGE